MKDYYGAKDVQDITGCCKAKAYQIIAILIQKFEKEYPEVITIKGKVPIWFFEEKMMNKKVG